MHDVTVHIAPGNFFIQQFYQLKMVMFLIVRIFDVKHHWTDADDRHAFHAGGKIFHFLSCIIDVIKFDLCGFKLLTCADSLVQIGAGGVNLFIERIGGMDA